MAKKKKGEDKATEPRSRRRTARAKKAAAKVLSPEELDASLDAVSQQIEAGEMEAAEAQAHALVEQAEVAESPRHHAWALIFEGLALLAQGHGMAGLSALLQGKAEVEEHCPDDAEDVAEMADIASKSWLDLATEALSSAEGIERGFLLLQRGGVHAMLLMGEKAQEDLRDALKELEEDPEGQTMAATLLAAVLDGEGRDREAKRLRRRYKIAED